MFYFIFFLYMDCPVYSRWRQAVQAIQALGYEAILYFMLVNLWFMTTRSQCIHGWIS